MAKLQLLGADSLQVLKLSGIETIEGKTAYQYAQDGGYTGTEEDFKLKMAQEIPTKTSQLTNDSGFLTTVDSELSSTSTNPVQNKIINAEIDNLNDLVGDTSVATQIANAVENKSDVGHTHSEYTNQNAFSNVVIGTETISSDSTTDTLTFVAGSNITLTPDLTNDKITIEATDTNTTYSLSKSGSTITLTGSDGSTTSVVDSDTNTTYNVVTQSTNGLMSSSDKVKLDDIETGANKTIIDSVLSDTSTNPVQNKVINTAINNLNTLVGDTAVSTQISTAISGLATETYVDEAIATAIGAAIGGSY